VSGQAAGVPVAGTAGAAAAAVGELTGAALDRWDQDAVDAPGGHVLQSRAWAEHRSARGWRPSYLAMGDARALVLKRGWPLLPGGSAYVPRGPVGPGTPWVEGEGAGTAIGEALVAIGAHLARQGIDVVAADPEVAGGDRAFADQIVRAGFHPIPEIQPSRHRMALALPPDGDATSVMDGVAKQTRQRIRRAERDGVCVVRWDAAPTALEGTVPGRTEDAATALDRFYGLLRETGDRRGFTFAGPSEFTAWWRRALAAGHLVYLEAREGGPDGDVLGGLVLYRHGRRLSTAHSGDRAERRHDHPGAMHLLRWRAIELALAERRTEMDLGGVDVAGARRPPEPGEPTHGLYEHKRSFGAEWVELAGARELVVRRWRYAAGRATSKAARLAVRGSGR
jgi:lipid II:glycine glycyltransferase (peptidoglycan interpeptide bridge formation enzyme)